MSKEKPLVATNVHHGLAQRFRLTRIHMVTGMMFLGPSWFSLIHAGEAITEGHWHHPSLLAAIHLFVVGFALTVVHGAILQIVPVVFQGRLHSIRLGYIQYVFMVLGSCFFPVGFLAKQWDIVTAGGILVLIAFVLLFWNLGQTVRTLKKRTEALWVMTTFLFLLVTVFAGLSLASRLPLIGRATLPVHITIGVIGLLTTFILTLSPRLMSFFVSSHYKKLRRIRPEFLFLIGMSLMAVGLVLKVEEAVTSVSAGALIGGWILYFAGYFQLLINLYRHFRNRRRKDVEWILKWIVAGLYVGLPLLGAWAITLSKLGSGNRWVFAMMLLVIFGFLQWNIAGYMAKILPFLYKMGRYGHGSAPETNQAPGRRPPAIRDMLPKMPTVTALLGFGTGAFFMAAGVLMHQQVLTLAGSIIGAVAWMLYAAAIAVMYNR